jgi:hypothetical protein
MSHLRYLKRTYARSSHTEAESFRPYFLAIVSIVFVTYFAVGVQNTVESINNFGGYSLASRQHLCKISNLSACALETTQNKTDTHGVLEQDLQSPIN